MSTHTPGPWMECGKPTGALHAVRAPSAYNKIGKIICDVGFGETNEINTANARLIAAAPDLLAALIALDDYVCNNLASDYPTGIDVDDSVFNAARSIVAKATGNAL